MAHTDLRTQRAFSNLQILALPSTPPRTPPPLLPFSYSCSKAQPKLCHLLVPPQQRASSSPQTDQYAPVTHLTPHHLPSHLTNEPGRCVRAGSVMHSPRCEWWCVCDVRAPGAGSNYLAKERKCCGLLASDSQPPAPDPSEVSAHDRAVPAPWGHRLETTLHSSLRIPPM